MPPKKPAAEKRMRLGRPGTSVKCGIVGLPNVGKSSFFNLLCGMSVPAENFPFCTIDPNLSRVAVPDERFDWLVNLYKPASAVPAHLSVMDIAGLVKGANEGAGLGNAFLSNVKAVDAIYHMVRVFEDDEVVHVEDTVDPVRDIDIIGQELRLKDLEWVNARVAELDHQVRMVDKTKKKELEIVVKVRDWLDAGRDIRHGDWSNEEVEVLNEMLLLTAKPTMYLLNLSEKDLIRKKNKWLMKIKQYVDEHGKDPIVPISVAFEAKLLEMTPDQREDYAKEVGMSSSLPKIIKMGLKALALQYFFTAGTDEVKAWTVREDSKAPQAAGRIHSDFERGFIMAETMKFEDLKELGNEAAVKGAGKYLQNGKNYVVQDGDIFHFKFNVTSAKKK
jgi:obg-like ATPase 1